MRTTRLVAAIFAAATLLLAQGDRGTITGTVTDPAGAVVPGAAVQVKNIETGAQYEVATTGTGNFTIVQVPAGNYQMSVASAGFRTYLRKGITVIVAQTLRLDVPLEVGATSDAVTVTEAAALLKTESGELSHAIETAKLDELPILGIGAQSASTWGLRNPLQSASLIPGTFFNSNTVMRVNGGMTNTESIRIEGQDATDKYSSFSTVMTQPSVDAVQEVAIQTSNYAAEYGQVGGGLFNFTMKSGTNSFHGTIYDYFVNTVFNAAQPYTNLKNAQHRNDFGGNVGGPLWIPKVYNGRNKTFFFLNMELYRETQLFSTTPQTVPTSGMRVGDFSKLLTSRNLGTDPLGRPILENTIYDPATARSVGGSLVTDPFSGNIIPTSRLDPVALKIQALIPLATTNGFVNNIVPAFPSNTSTTTPAFKADQYLGSKLKVSFYISSIGNIRQYSPGTGNADGLPLPITAARGNFIRSWTSRANLEYSISPTLLFHLGVGYQHLDFEDKSPVLTYNAQQQLGLTGATVNRNFPTLTGLLSSNGFGGMVPMGPNSQTRSLMIKPTGNASLTWVRGNHTYKTGTEIRIEGFPAQPFVPANGAYAFSAAETGLPYLQNTTIGGGAVGAPYASFLLGQVDSGRGGVVTNTRLGKHEIGLFLQDTWKISRKLTLDYGLRWDYSTYLKEQYGRVPDFSPTTPNPTAGNLPGAVIYEGNGAGHCNCQFANNYPFALAPRIGGAYQITPTWVLRAGFGMVYADTGEGGNTASSSIPFNAPSFGVAATTLSQGIPLTAAQLAWPNFNPGQYPIGGIPAPLTANLIDQNAGRPARQVMWSVGLQHSFGQNLLVEASYVGNRGVWWNAPSLINANALTPQILAAHGLSLSNPADISLLTSAISSTTAKSRGFGTAPYAGFPTTATVAQSLRPFPQFTTINEVWAPLGKTWYDSLQAKVTKRLSRGLDFTTVFTWQKSLTLGAESDTIGPGGVGAVEGNVFNRDSNKYISGQDQPFVFVTAINYMTPAIGGNKQLAWLLKDWQTGVVLNYSSGVPILAPYSNNNLNAVTFLVPSVSPQGTSIPAGATATFANRVPGQPLYTQDINCHCFDPSNTFILNPKAWADPPAGQFGGPAYYSDYRNPRRPQESVNLGRIWKLRERVQMQIRIDFQNVLNRAYFASPTSINANASQVRAPNGTTTAGFGYISTATPLASTFAAPGPRAGNLVLKFIF